MNNQTEIILRNMQIFIRDDAVLIFPLFSLLSAVSVLRSESSALVILDFHP
jgi:hypothetical protein